MISNYKINVHIYVGNAYAAHIHLWIPIDEERINTKQHKSSVTSINTIRESQT